VRGVDAWKRGPASLAEAVFPSAGTSRAGRYPANAQMAERNKKAQPGKTTPVRNLLFPRPPVPSAARVNKTSVVVRRPSLLIRLDLVASEGLEGEEKNPGGEFCPERQK
jgi:hypothetical protein